MPLGPAREPFSHPDWIFEIKWDGFRSLVHVEHGACKLVSRNGNEFKSFAVLNEAIAAEVKARSTVLDGEIVCLTEDEEFWNSPVGPRRAFIVNNAS
jgi:bifunctional non-homologous end joining protein LigD